VTIHLKTMNSDLELLQEYARNKSEDAFTSLVNRHLNLVYSAALRQVRSPQIAEEVVQSVFADLAHGAGKLNSNTILTAWLYAVTRRTAIDVIRKESRRRLREQIAVEMENMNATANDWTQIAPLLDDAMAALDETDRSAVLLRFFENKSLHEVGKVLGASEDAAQKRVSRAVERLREFFSKRNVTIGASGLIVLISANAVQAAPVGLAISIPAAVLAGTAISTSTLIATTTKAIAMTTLQKTLITATAVVLAGTGIYEARQASQLHNEVQTLEKRQSSLAGQIQQLQSERDNATNRLTALSEEIARLKSEQKQAELLRLRGQVGSLRQQLAATDAKDSSPASGFAKMMSDPAMRDYIQQAGIDLIKRRYGALFQELKLTPEQIEKFIQLMGAEFQSGIQRLSASQQGGVNPPGPAQSATDDNLELGNQLESLLGASGAARFNEYTQEIPARTTVDLLNVQLGGNKLTDDQSARLFQLVKSEPFELTHGISGDLDKAFFGSQADIDSHLAKVAESNQHVVQEAGSFLNAEQLAALNTVLSNGITARITQGAAFSQKH
jgi:RNA polymerase sigma factor (sigma-70 family)